MTRRVPRTLDAALAGRDNNFNLLRMIAASAVLVSHAFPIALGPGAIEPLESLTGRSLAYYAVAVFFGISGLLIARSWDRRPDVARFVTARVLRLYPALVVVLAVTVLAGSALTRLSPASYWSDPATLAYVPRNLSLAFPQWPLPGVFTGNPYGSAINGSLWTLAYEVACYAALALAGGLGLFRRRRLFTLAIAAVAAAHLAVLYMLPREPLALSARLLADLAFPFALGTLCYLWRDRLPLSAALALPLWAAAALGGGSAIHPSLIVAALIFTAFLLALAPTPLLHRYNRLGDYSYGTYIYAFPMQQLAVWLMPGQSPLENMAIAFPAALLLAALSWHLLEQRSLAAVDRVAILLRRPIRRARLAA